MTDQLLIVLLGFFFIGFIFYRKDKYKDHDAFFLSEKDSGLLSSTLSISSTLIGATSMLALSGWVIQYGPAATWYLISPGIGLIILGIFGVKKIREKDGSIIGDYFHNKYVSVVLTAFIAIIYTLILGAQIVGFSSVVKGFAIPYLFGILYSGIVITAYILIGGFSAVRDTDMVQFVLIFISVLTLLVVTPVTFRDFSVAKIVIPSSSLPRPLFTLFLTVGLMTFVAQENHQRIKSAKTDGIARLACVLAGCIILLFALTIKAISVSIGGSATNPILSLIPTLSAPTKLLVSTGILAAALSTSDSALNISAYSCARMFNDNPTKQLIYFSTILSIIIAMIVAHIIPSIRTIILVCINIYIGIILPITAASIFNNRKWTIIIILLVSSLSVAISYGMKFSAPGLSGFLTGTSILLIAKILFRGGDN